ncbi:hypothetical protein LJR289_005144 [Pseudoduganella sp. LjRoot289]|uniref:hypothetical protein n=1 Tax=Pseudoduganella sp. LjRoot289 TaxID=3342314 RepID=UPI003ECEA2B0
MTPCLPAARFSRTAAIACCLLLPACASQAPAPAVPPAAPVPAFGAATRAVLAQQIADPDAASRTRNPAAAGMDGRAAGQAQGRYQKSFTEPPAQQSSFTIGVSGGK